MAKKRAHEHADERWLLTYADMITLLMALFMVLFSMAVVNKGKFEELAKSLKESFSGPLGPGGDSILSDGTPIPAPVPASQEDVVEAPVEDGEKKAAPPAEETRRAIERARAQEVAQGRSLEDAKERIDAKIAALDLEEQVETQISSRGLVVRLITDRVLFEVGSATIKPSAYGLLSSVAKAVNGVGANPIRVVGHTDAIPFAGDRHGNEKLSHERALAVFFYMQDHGFSVNRHPDSAAQGFGERDPLVPNDPATGAGARNRRVEILVQRLNYVERARKESKGAIGSNPAGVPPIEPDKPQIHP